jgi:hypothetical protein
MLRLVVVGSGAFVVLAMYQLHQSYNAMIADRAMPATLEANHRYG